MVIQPYKLEDRELLSKARAVIEKVEATRYEKDVLSAIVNRFMFLISDVETTNRWAKESFEENKRLIELIKERWKPENPTQYLINKGLNQTEIAELKEVIEMMDDAIVLKKQKSRI